MGAALATQVLEEMLQTEANYLADLRYTGTSLMQPLAALIDAETHSRLFANLGQIVLMHEQVRPPVIGRDWPRFRQLARGASSPTPSPHAALPHRWRPRSLITTDYH